MEDNSVFFPNEMENGNFMRNKWPVWIAMGLLLVSCDPNQNAEDPVVISVRQLPILGGTRVTGNDYMSTVALTLSYGSYSDTFCTGTLISPNYVLTAGHCISYCEGDSTNIERMRPQMKVGIGHSESSFVQMYDIESFHPHPNFICSKYQIENDIALIKLKKSVPLSVATPTPPMPPQYDMTPSEVDSLNGVTVTTVGFGLTNPNDDYSSGVKYSTELKVYAYCPKTRSRSKKCSSNAYLQDKGVIYFYTQTTGTCQGDSGGPTFMTRHDTQYVAGVTSYGYEGCVSYSAVTMVSDHYNFIAGIVEDLAAADPEICDNEKDDNNDGLIDCDDPYCFGLKRCIPEICDNDRDENDNGLVDCADPQCTNDPVCQPEDCNNGIDDNGDGKKDCEDRQCKDLIQCQPEICDNQIDDNANGLMDCADPQCSALLICQPEICNDYKDNNGNGLVDCDDPQCETNPLCLPEICNDGTDNNGDKLIDCADPQCRSALECQPENCNDKIDNNGNGLIDCADAQCFSFITCQPEICDDDIDNNADGLIDCDDPQCLEDDACHSKAGSSEGCTASPKSSHPQPFGGLLAFLAIIGLGLKLRRKS